MKTPVKWPSTAFCHGTRLEIPASANAVTSSDRRLAVKVETEEGVSRSGQTSSPLSQKHATSKGWQKAPSSQWAGKREAGLCSEVSAFGIISARDRTVCLSACSDKSWGQVLLWLERQFLNVVPISTCHPQQCLPGPALALAPKIQHGELKCLRMPPITWGVASPYFAILCALISFSRGQRWQNCRIWGI